MEPSPTPAAPFNRSQTEVSTRSAGDRKSPGLELLREPLVLFFVAGALLFALDRAVDSLRGDAEIRVPAPVRAAAAAKLEASLGRAASDDEVRAALGTWIREEAVYREGLRRGLDKSDPVIRERVVHKTLVALHRENAAPEIDDAELERWFSVRLQRYSQPTIFDLEVMTLLVSPTDTEIAALLERLNRSEQQPAEPGPQARLHIYRDAPEGLLVRSYGAGLIAMARSVAPGQWVRVPGDQTVHLLRVHQVRGAEPPRFDGLRARVLDDWRREQREQALEQRLKQLVQPYRIRYTGD
jgi:hypothetical protein